jgi:hypothetical protein
VPEEPTRPQGIREVQRTASKTVTSRRNSRRLRSGSDAEQRVSCALEGGYEELAGSSLGERFGVSAAWLAGWPNSSGRMSPGGELIRA